MTKAQLKSELNKCLNAIASARVSLSVAQSKIGADSNSDKFKTGSEFMYYFEASSKLKLLEFLSVSFKYWRWYNTAYYNDMYQSAVTPFFNISWDKFFLDIGPVFSVSYYPSRYKEKFSFHGRIGYELLKRKKKND